MDIELFNNKLKVFECGKVLVLGNRYPNKDEYYEKKYSISNNYRQFMLSYKGKYKHFKIHRIIAYAYLGLDIDNPKIQIDHMDMDKQNNQLTNLRIVSNQQNQFNRKVKGYSKMGNRYKAEIGLNGKQYYLGLYPTRELAHNAYLEGKKILHIIPIPIHQ